MLHYLEDEAPTSIEKDDLLLEARSLYSTHKPEPKSHSFYFIVLGVTSLVIVIFCIQLGISSLFSIDSMLKKLNLDTLMELQTRRVRLQFEEDCVSYWNISTSRCELVKFVDGVFEVVMSDEMRQEYGIECQTQYKFSKMNDFVVFKLNTLVSLVSLEYNEYLDGG